MLKKISIQGKIVFPYTLLFSAVIVAMALMTIAIFHRQMDQRIEGQMRQMASAISNIAFLLSSDDNLSSMRIKEAIGADIIVYRQDGVVTATTLDRNTIGTAMAAIKSSDVEKKIFQEETISIIRDIGYSDHAYKIIYHRLLSMPDAILSLMVSTADITQAKQRFRMFIGLIAISVILLVAVIGSIIARSITAPVKQLVDVTEQIAAGDLEVEAAVKTRDEIGALANSINKMTRDLQISRGKLVQSEKLAVVGQLAAGIAHEIRNPLTSVKMIVQLLKRRLKGDETGEESVQAVLDEIIRLEVIINGLLDFARPMELQLKKVNVADVLNDVLKIMAADLRHRKIELVNNTDTPLPQLMLDTDRMKQVFMNIILNAMQAMPEGGKLTINGSDDPQNRILRIEISDTGIGMSQEVLSRVFEPFFSQKPGGTGLGLANVLKIMEQHSGDIQIESIEGVGTKAAIVMEYKT